MTAEFLLPNDPRWMKALELLEHDVYHTPQYVEHAARQEGGTATCFLAEVNGATLFIPLLVRSLPKSLHAPGDWSDATSPYGYPGPLLTPQTDLETARVLFDCFRESSIERSLVTAFVRLHPLFPLANLAAVGGGELVHHGSTIYIDLNSAKEDLVTQVRSGHRYEIRRLAREGYYVVMNDWSRYDQFIGLYLETMRRVVASDRYYFSDKYFHELRTLLGPRLHFGCVFSAEGNLTSGSLFSETGDIVQYHLSATSDEFVRKSPSKLLLGYVRDWAKDRGNRFFHLGGGLGADGDSLFRFKAGFSKLRADFYTLRFVLDRKKYYALTRESQISGAHVPAERSFFPIYRHAA